MSKPYLLEGDGAQKQKYHLISFFTVKYRLSAGRKTSSASINFAAPNHDLPHANSA